MSVLLHFIKGKKDKNSYVFLYYLSSDEEKGLFIKEYFVMGRTEEIINNSRKSEPESYDSKGIYSIKNFLNDDKLEKEILVRNMGVLISYCKSNWDDMIKWANEEGMLHEARISAISKPTDPNEEENSDTADRRAPSDDQLAQDWGYEDWDDFSAAQD